MAARITLGAYKILPVFLLLTLLIIVVSCSGSGGDPTSPGFSNGNFLTTEKNDRNAMNPSDWGSHQTFGIYTWVIDQEAQTIEVIDNRSLAAHLNVRPILESSFWCPAKNCIKLQFIDIDPDNFIYTVKATLVNPTAFVGYDIRGIVFYDEKAHRLLNPDAYTKLYAPMDNINPFRAYAKTVENRQFSAYASYSEIFEMYIPPDPKKWFINYALDASWPMNCEEPYDLDNWGFDGSIYQDDPDLEGIDQGEGTIFVEAYDWQKNVSEVSIDTTPITGDITQLEFNISTARWEASITNGMDAEQGEYEFLIAAFSEDDPDLGLYNYMTIKVDPTPPPAVQSIWGNVGDSFLLTGLDNAVLSVVNQDPLGFQPSAVLTEDGFYQVMVTTGIFDVSVAATDGLHLDSTAWNVAVTTDEDVRLDFGLQYPNRPDPTGGFFETAWDQIFGVSGRVVDSFGMPISAASVELTSPDYVNFSVADPGQDFVAGGETDENGYFNMTNLARDSFDGTLNTYFLTVNASGHEGQVHGPYSTAANETEYYVFALDAHGQTPVWEDDFETDMGWGMAGYYHRQEYSPSIVNMSYLPQNQWLWLPAGEPYGGAIPPPPHGGEYYLWYGEEQYGNFIGEPDSFNTQWGGGDSLFEHFGTATSPSIDLSDYTEARVEFDMSWIIEGVQPADFELMHFYVNGVDTRFFNTFIEPGPSAFTASMSGWNRPPIWMHFVYDISAYAGGNVTLSFAFSTEDSLYNGCRGQFIDNVQVFAE
ncbi:MAG TPA: carboxypeptidase-like regulatory domain-containing protein [bacterium]|jgi:hypothetical protein